MRVIIGTLGTWGAGSRAALQLTVGAGDWAMQMGGMGAAGVVPLLRYRDCAAAVEWLCRAFSFERQLVVDTPEGGVAFAQLACGGGLIMVGPVGDSGLDSHLKQPDELGGASTQACYLAVDDLEGHYEHAQSEGADIILPLETSAVGSRGYSCRDLEGHIWNFGSYDPWRAQRKSPPERESRRDKRRPGLATALTLAMIALAGGAAASIKSGWVPWSGMVPFSGDGETTSDTDMTTNAQGDAKAALKFKADAEAQLALAEAALAEARLEIAREIKARRHAEDGANAAIDRIAADIRQELETERNARTSTEQRLTAAEAALAEARTAKESAERRVGEFEKKIATEIRAREEAETAVRELRARVSMPHPAAGGISTAAAPPLAASQSQAPSTPETGAIGPGATNPQAAAKPRGSVRAWSQTEAKAKRQRAKKDVSAAKAPKPKAPKPPTAVGPDFKMM